MRNYCLRLGRLFLGWSVRGFFPGGLLFPGAEFEVAAGVGLER